MTSTETAKTFVLDTNVLIHDPEALFKFEEHHLLIPIFVIEELDGLKKGANEVGRNARHTLRLLDALDAEGKLGSPSETRTAFVNDSKGTLEIALSSPLYRDSIPQDLDWDKKDNKIIAVAVANEAILVTKDTNVRVKARAIGVKTADYETDKVNYDGLYSGHSEAFISENDLNLLYSEGFATKNQVNLHDCPPNEYVTFYSTDNPKHSAIARYDAFNEIFVLVSGSTMKPAGLMPKNSEQLMAIDALMNPDIKLVTLVGVAGTGKTLCALAAAIQGVDSQEYSKALVARPVVPMGNDVGYLPGSLEEKLGPWMAPIRDSVDFLMGTALSHKKEPKKETKEPKKSSKASKPGKVVKELERDYYEKDAGKLPGVDELVAHGMLELCTLTFMRGRSIPNQFIVVDEVQNCSPHEIKTLITRAGEGTKIVLTGDPDQIDTPYLDASSNGLTYVVDRFREEKIAAHVTLTKGERSELAEIAARIL